MIQSLHRESRLNEGHGELVKPYCQSYVGLTRLKFIYESHEIFFLVFTLASIEDFLNSVLRIA